MALEEKGAHQQLAQVRTGEGELKIRADERARHEPTREPKKRDRRMTRAHPKWRSSGAAMRA